MTEQTIRRQSTAQILSQLAEGQPDEQVDLQSVVAVFGRRAFAVLFLLAALFAMNPIPGLAGAVSGAFVLLAGLQLLVGRKRPWFPQFILRRSIRRSVFQATHARLKGLLARTEHVIRPRLTFLFDGLHWSIFSGLLLTVFGILVLLPIPFTNFAFGVLLLFYCVAYVERDGGFLVFNWLVTIGVILVFGVLSGTLVQAAHDWLQTLHSL